MAYGWQFYNMQIHLAYSLWYKLICAGLLCLEKLIIRHTANVFNACYELFISSSSAPSIVRAWLTNLGAETFHLPICLVPPSFTLPFSYPLSPIHSFPNSPIPPFPTPAHRGVQGCAPENVFSNRIAVRECWRIFCSDKCVFNAALCWEQICICIHIDGSEWVFKLGIMLWCDAQFGNSKHFLTLMA